MFLDIGDFGGSFALIDELQHRRLQRRRLISPHEDFSIKQDQRAVRSQRAPAALELTDASVDCAVPYPIVRESTTKEVYATPVHPVAK